MVRFFGNYFRNLLNAFIEGNNLLNLNSNEPCFEVLFYRIIHLLVESYNTVVRSLLLLLSVTNATAQVISASTLILQNSSTNLVLLLFFGMTVIQTILTFQVVYGFAGNFFWFSKSSLLQLKRQVGFQYNDRLRREHHYREKFLRSCQVQKVRFGWSNFIEKTTPPIFQLFCLNRIIDLLLVR